MIILGQIHLTHRWHLKVGHGIDQVLHLAVEQDMAIGGLELLKVIGAVDIPVVNGEAIVRADDTDPKIAAIPLEPDLACVDVCAKYETVTVACVPVVVPDGIMA